VYARHVRKEDEYPTEIAKMKVMAGLRLLMATANVADVRAKLSKYRF
jgi:hypothetical protein